MEGSEKKLVTAITAWLSRTGIEPEKIPFLPEDVIANILKRLPAEFLHLVARRVCKTWARILRLPSFIESQMLYSTSCLLVSKYTEVGNRQQILEMRGKEILGAELNFPIEGRVMCSSEGIILIQEHRGQQRLFVSNPAIMQFVELPQLPSQWNVFAILRIPQSGEIKVLSRDMISDGGPFWHTITLGNNMSWKVLNIQDIGLGGVSLGGVYYIWCITVGSISNISPEGSISYQSILAINFCNETVELFKVKGPLEFYNYSPHLILLGNCLCCVTMTWGAHYVGADQIFTDEFDIWQLKDFSQNEWFIVKRIYLTEEMEGSSYRCMAWLHHQEIIVFHCVNQLVAYDEQTGQWIALGKKGEEFSEVAILHTSSLIPLSF